MPEFARSGEFCPNPGCSDYGKLQKPHAQGSIQKFGKTKRKRQRYRCTTCGKTFTETRGTLLYRRRTSEEELLETLAFVAEGVRISSLARVKRHKEETILGWIGEASHQAEAIEEVLMADYQVTRGQLDALWSYVGHKGKKGGIPSPTRKESSGALP